MDAKTIYAVVDLETTSNQNQAGRIMQVAVVFVRNQKIINQFSTLVNPGQPIPVGIQKLTHINDAMVKKMPFFEDVAQTLHAMLSETVIVAHNINFDLPFLNAEFERVGLTALTNLALDTVTLAQILWPTANSYRLGDLTHQLGIAHLNPHRADSDAKATGELLIAAQQKALRLPMITLQQLNDLPLALPRDTKQIFTWALAENRRHPQPLANNLEVVDRLALRRFATPSAYKQHQPELHFPKKEDEKRTLLTPSLDYRVSQARLMNQIYEHYTSGELSNQPGETAMVVEAPTGMGKTLGYLMPLAYLAIQQGRQVVLSVPTKTLQKQISTTINQTLKNILPFEVRGVQLKGQQNYLNLQSFKRSLARDEGSIAMQFLKAQILVWLTETLTGDFDELNLNNVSHDFLRQLAQTANNPEASKFYHHEFAHRQSILRTQATFLVVNHAYLTRQVQQITQQAKKPFLVIDEAQNLPDVVLQHSRHQISWSGLIAQAQLLQQNLMVKKNNHLNPIFERLPNGQRISQQFIQTMEPMVDLLVNIQQSLYRQFVLSAKMPANVGKDEYLVPTDHLIQFWVEHQNDFKQVQQLIQQLRLSLDQMMEAFIQIGTPFSIDERQSLADFRYLIERIGQTNTTLNTFQDAMIDYAETSVFWLTDYHGQSGPSLQLTGGLLHTKDYFKNNIYPAFLSPLMIGATLFNSAKSTYLYTRLNLDQQTAQVEKFKDSFDWANQAELLLVEDGPVPGSPMYGEYLSQQLLAILQKLSKNTLVLFTSLELMEQVYHVVTENKIYRDSDMTVLAQGISGNKSKILKRLQNEQHLMVFGALSFWEGIDLPNQQLELLILTRLPFEQPDTILQKVEEQQLAASKQSFFHQSVLPKATLKLRQGVGRLIRSDQDGGAIVILDSRIVNKQYGKTMQKMLPEALPKQVITHQQLVDKLLHFFNRDQMNNK
ncbi:DEAD/DEAH box helicase [Weissella coleopterorum]|uniref:3'-5' exonuclease DinG n=1 Tax=Weissella coleopterorum TaxID=2714949 RepID=A0A6G8B0T4_9LACO|nr:helicase C-terminal domain-containing protein [Weissella coleopterorum]QIL50840.1 DEAD/DEAH box helicase [Weissella coleopterorum]